MLIYLQLIEDRGNQEKFRLLYEAYRSQMYWAAFRILRREADTEDAVQEAFLRIAKNMDRISDPVCHKTRTLAVIIAEHAALNLYQMNRRHPTVELDEERFAAPEKLPETGTLAEALALLPPRYRQVLLLRFYHGYSNPEIAALLSTTPENVSQLIHRGREKLGEILRGQGVEL